MIIEALHRHFEAELAEGRVPPVGYRRQRIDVVIELDCDGRIIGVAREPGRDAVHSEVPEWAARTSQPAPSFLTDPAPYVLGDGIIATDKPKKTETIEEAKARTARQLRAHADKHVLWSAEQRKLIGDSDDAGLRALIGFLDWWTPSNAHEVFGVKLLASDAVAFRFDGNWLHARPAARAIWESRQASDLRGVCAITGEVAPIARLHRGVRGIRGKPGDLGKPAAIVTANADCAKHYGRVQGDISPISARVAHGYVAALEHIITRGDAIIWCGQTLAYWTEATGSDAKTATDALALILSGRIGVTGEDERARLRLTMDAIAQLRDRPLLEPQAAFHMLAIEPGTGRHAIRMHIRSTLGALRSNIDRYLADVAFGSEPRPIDVQQLLSALYPKSEPPPPIYRDFVRAALLGEPFPRALLHVALGRVQAERVVRVPVAIIIKAVLGRTLKEQVTVGLCTDHPNPAYHLGRLLALVTAIQAASNPKSASSVRERYLTFMQAHPHRAFPGLMNDGFLYMREVARRRGGGLAHHFEGRLAEIAAKITDVPQRMSAADQGYFVLGLAHQMDADRQVLKKKREGKTSTDAAVDLAAA